MPRSACVRNMWLTFVHYNIGLDCSYTVSVSYFLFPLFQVRTRVALCLNDLYVFNTVRNMQGVNINDCSHSCMRVKLANSSVACMLTVSCGQRLKHGCNVTLLPFSLCVLVSFCRDKVKVQSLQVKKNGCLMWLGKICYMFTCNTITGIKMLCILN